MLSARALPSRRTCERQHAHVANHSVFVDVDRVGGAIVAVRVELHREGAALRGWAEAMAGVISVGLQHGVPLDELVEPLIGVRCDPSGDVEGHEEIRAATSIPDYVGRCLLAWRPE